MDGIQIFLSTVSAEFLSYREALRHRLTRPNVSIAIQEDFIPTGTETLAKLDDYICGSHAVIHLVGDMTGALAQPPSVTVIRERYPDLEQRLPPLAEILKADSPAISYTQWEAWLALYHRKVLIIAVPQSEARRDERYRLEESQRQTQLLHLGRLERVERYPEIRFTHEDGLALEVLRSSVFDIFLAKAMGKSDRGLEDYLEAIRQMGTTGYIFAQAGKRHSLFISLRARERGESFTDGEKSNPIPYERLLSAEYQARSSRCLWVSGPPGSGKTTLLLHLARSAWFDPLSVGLDAPCLPIFLRLRCLAASSGIYLGQRLRNALDLAADLSTGGLIPEDFVERWSAATGAQWLLLLDGIDEVATEQRPAIFEWIERQVDAGFRVVTTSRPQVDLPESLAGKVTYYSISSLSKDEQKRLAEGLLETQAVTLLDALNKPGREALRDNPLLFSLAAFVFQHRGELPRRRIDLYERAVKAWFDNARAREFSAHVTQETYPFIRETLEAIAYFMSENPQKSQIQDILPAVARTLAEHTGRPRRFFSIAETGGAFVEALGRHSSFFEVLGQTCGWIHPTFREYFTAQFLAKQLKEGMPASEILDRASDPGWRQIMLMLLTLHGDDQPIDDLFSALADSGPDGALFAAQALLEGVRIGEAAAQNAVQRLVEAVRADVEISVCASLLTPGHDERNARNTTARILLENPLFRSSSQWLNDSLTENCRTLERSNDNEAWNHRRETRVRLEFKYLKGADRVIFR